MRETKYHAYLDSEERTILLHSLVELKNQLIQQGRYTDCVDELIVKVIIIVLACIIFSLFAAAPPVVNPDAAAVTMVWSYVGELIFNMLILVGAVKMADRVVREMMGL